MITMVGGYDQHQAVQAAKSGKFITTKWATPKEKAECFFWLKDFMTGGCRGNRRLWNKKTYKWLSGHLFGHIAHYDIFGFWDYWFEREIMCHTWVDNIAKYTVYGDPAWTWSDVEAAIKMWLHEVPSGLTLTNLAYIHAKIERQFYLRDGTPKTSQTLLFGEEVQ